MAKKDQPSVVTPITTDADIQYKVRLSSKVIVKEDRKRQKRDATHSQVEAIMQDTTTRMNDNKGMMELLPDLNLLASTLVSSILSPKDLMSVEMNIQFEGLEFDKELPADLAHTFTNHFRETYPLESKLSTILMEALFKTGSYVVACIPESTLEAMVKSGLDEPSRGVRRYAAMESHDAFINTFRDAFKPIGLLGTGKSTQTRSGLLRALEVSDNYNYLKTRTVHRSITSQAVTQSLGLEGYAAQPLLTIGAGNAASGTGKSNPMVQKWPSDAVLPVHTPSNPTDHLGYYVMVDAKGNVVSRSRGGDYLKKLRDQIAMATNKDVVGSYMSTWKLNITRDSSLDDVRSFVDKAAEVIEAELLEQLKDGVYGDEVEVTRPQELYALMLSRLLEQKKTRLIYIPKELVTYFAFEYDDLGIGISLLEGTKIFGILRAVLMLAEVMNGVKSSIGTTRLDINIDEDDPNWRETVEQFVQEFANVQTDSLPMNYISPGDIVKALHRAQVDVHIEGGDFPKSDANVTDVPRNYSTPDSTLRESLRRQQYSGLHLSPEIVDATMEGDLATLVNSRNLQHAKQVMELSNKFKPMLADHVQIYTRCSDELIEHIRAALSDIGEDASNENIAKVIRAIRVRLPEPDMARHRHHGEAYTEYRQFIEEAVACYVTEDSMAEFFEGEVDPRVLQSLRASFVNVIMRDWLRRQNLFPELEELFYADTKGSKLEDRIGEHNKDVLTALGAIMSTTIKSERKVKEKLDKLNEEEAPADDNGGGPEGTPPAEGDEGDGGGWDNWSDDEGGDAAPADEGEEEPEGEAPAAEPGDETPEDDAPELP